LEDPSVVCDVLEALARKLDGTAAAPDYFSRRRRVMHRVLGYAVWKRRLSKNPLSKGNLPEGWSPPPRPEDAIDPRSVGSPELVADMLIVAKEFTDQGTVHEDRGLKGRSRQARSRMAVRNVPIPPALVRLLREHIDRFGTRADRRLFRSENDAPIQPSTYWQVWGKTRALALTPEQLATPLMRRPYELRHSGVTWRLNSGVPPTEVAAWAGHSVEVLMRVYARCVAGLEGVWIARMDATLNRASSQALRPKHPSQDRGQNGTDE